MSQAKLRGEVVIRPLDSVKPNAYNPNRMTKQMMESMKHGFKEDGWLVSQALLIWGKDDKGKQQDVIIDGEHRWTTGRDLGMLEGPMVFLDGVTEAQAKALTIKMNQKRGVFDDTLLADVIKDISEELGSDDLGLDLGFDDEFIMGLMSGETSELEGEGGSTHKAETARGFETKVAGGEMRSAGTHVRLVQLFFDKEQHEQFQAAIKTLAVKYETTNVTETVLMAIEGLTKED